MSLDIQAPGAAPPPRWYSPAAVPRPQRLPPHYRDSRFALGQAFEAQRFTNPVRYAEQRAMVEAMMSRAEHWRTHEVRLPRGVAVVPMLDDDDRTVYTIEWGRDPPPLPPTYFFEHCVAVETTWTVFMLRRPWAIDDDRLRALVEQPPVPHAQILGALLSIRFAAWIRRAFGLVAHAWIETPPPDVPNTVLEDLGHSFAALVRCYEARADLSVRELSGLLDVAETDSGLGHEIHRWGCMLSDYTHAIDQELHERLQALDQRFHGPTPGSVREAWDSLNECRELDACLGVVLARVAMLDTSSRPSIVLGYVDPMATRAAGSFAWWCRHLVETLGQEYPLGDRLRSDEISTFVRFALQQLRALDEGLTSSLLRVFPIEV